MCRPPARCWFDGATSPACPYRSAASPWSTSSSSTYPAMTVYENIASPLRVAGEASAKIDTESRAAELLRLTPLTSRLLKKRAAGLGASIYWLRRDSEVDGMRGGDQRSGATVQLRGPRRLGLREMIDPLRRIRAIVNEALAALEQECCSARIRRSGGRRSRPSKLLRAMHVAGVLHDPLGAAFDGAAGV